MSEILRKFGEFTISTSISWLNPLGPGHPNLPLSIEQLKVDAPARTLISRIRNLNDLHLLTKIRLVTLFDDPLDPVEAHRRTPKLRLHDDQRQPLSRMSFEEEARNSVSVVMDPRGSNEVAVQFGEATDSVPAIRLCLQLSATPVSEPTTAGGTPT